MEGSHMALVTMETYVRIEMWVIYLNVPSAR